MKKIKKNKLEKYQNSGPVKDQSFIPSINNIFQQGLGIAPNITNPGGNPFGTNIFGDQLTKGIFDTGQLFKGTQQLNQLETPLGAWGGDVSKGIEKSILDEDMKKYKADNFFNSAKAWADESGQTFSEPSKMFGAYQKSIQDRAGQRYDNTISAQKTWNEYGKPLAANMAAMEKLTDMQAVEGLKGNKNALYRVDDEVKGMESKGIFQMGGAPQISALQQALGYKDNSPFKKLPSQTILRNMSADGVNITMDGVSKNLYLIPDKGRPVLAQGNSGEYYFPNANAVEEIPAYQNSGAITKQDPMQTPTEPTYNYLTDFEKLEYVKKLKGYVEKYGFDSLAESDPKGVMYQKGGNVKGPGLRMSPMMDNFGATQAQNSQWAHFPSGNDAISALDSLLFSGNSKYYKSNTKVADALAKYSGGDYSKHKYAKKTLGNLKGDERVELLNDIVKKEVTSDNYNTNYAGAIAGRQIGPSMMDYQVTSRQDGGNIGSSLLKYQVSSENPQKTISAFEAPIADKINFNGLGKPLKSEFEIVIDNNDILEALVGMQGIPKRVLKNISKNKLIDKLIDLLKVNSKHLISTASQQGLQETVGSWQDGGNINPEGYTPGFESMNNKYNEIPSGNITMQQTPVPLLGIAKNGGSINYLKQKLGSNISTGRGRYAKEGGTIQNFQNSGSPIINPNQATRQDSINVTNAAKAVDAYYASLMKKGWYSKKDVLKIPTSLTQNEFKKSMDRVKERSISTYENDIESARILGEPDMYYRNVYPKRDLSQYLSEVEKSLSDTKKGSGTKYYYKDLLPSIIDPVAPSTLIDTRIKPQFVVEYRAKYPRDKKRSPVGGSVTALYTYDPIATTPVDLLTPSELKRRQELYPDSFGAKPSIKTNKKPFKKEIPPSPRDLVEIDPLQQQELRQLDIPQRQVDMSNVEHTDYESGEMVKPYEGVPNVNVVFKKRKSDGRLVPFAYENSEGERIGYNETLTKKFQYPGKFQSGGIPILNLSKNINPMRLNPQGIYKMGGLITEGSEYNKRKQPKKNSITGASSTGPMGPKDIPSYDGGIRAIIDQEKNEIIPTENLIPIQTEKGELIVLPTGDVVPVMAKKRHHQMDEDEVTDVAPEGAYILSSFGRVKIKKKEAENVIAETGVKPYKLGIGQETPTEKTLGDIMTKKEMAPAEVGKLISRRFPVIATDNPYEAAANTENKINRRPYLEGLIQLSEFDKMRKGIDTSTPEATREYSESQDEGMDMETEEMMNGGNPMFRDNISHAPIPLAVLIPAISGLIQAGTSIFGASQQKKSADQAYRDVLRLTNQSADKQRGQLGLGAAAGILGTLSQDPTVNAVNYNPTYINQMQTRTPSQITDSIANSAFANMPTYSNLAPQQQMMASQAAWGQALKAAGDARMNAWAGDRTARNQQLTALQGYSDKNEESRIAAQNATRLNRNQQIGNVGDRTQGYFDSTATIEANLGQTQANARLGQGAAQQQAIRSYTQGINQAIGTAGAAAYDYFSKKDGTTGTTTPPNTCWSLPDSMGRRYQIPC